MFKTIRKSLYNIRHYGRTRPTTMSASQWIAQLA